MRIENHPILSFDKGRKVKFTFDGKEVEGFESETVAAALHASGIRVLSHSVENHRPRGLYCAIGNCSSCMMTVNGEPNVKICIVRCMDKMIVETQTDRGHLPVASNNQSRGDQI